MELNITAKWILGILATILLGALGSGLWNLVFDPLVKWLGKFFISVSTLGLKSLQNSLYAEVAKGHRDRGVRILMLILFVGISVPALLPFAMEKKYQLIDEETAKAIKIVESQNIKEGEKKEKIEMQLEELRLERREKAKVKLILLTSFLLCVLSFQYFKIIFIENSISLFERYFRICLPYFSGDEENKIRSNFALIQTKEDYSKVIEHLESIAENNDISLPL